MPLTIPRTQIGRTRRVDDDGVAATDRVALRLGNGNWLWLRVRSVCANTRAQHTRHTHTHSLSFSLSNTLHSTPESSEPSMLFDAYISRSEWLFWVAGALNHQDWRIVRGQLRTGTSSKTCPSNNLTSSWTDVFRGNLAHRVVSFSFAQSQSVEPVRQIKYICI